MTLELQTMTSGLEIDADLALDLFNALQVQWERSQANNLHDFRALATTPRPQFHSVDVDLPEIDSQ